jgi:tetratricopeptide (TPR) repeat protein
MKKPILTLVLTLSLGVLLSAQIRSAHYEITVPTGSTEGNLFANEAEQRFEAYNRVFRFNPARLPGLLRVRIFTQKAEYDSYVSSKLGTTKPGAVYIHYNNPDNRELVIHRGSGEEDNILPHQTFIQFLRAFVPQAPSWIREGFAVHFNTLVYNKDKGTLEYEENLSWLETVKRSAVNPEAILLADKNGIPPNFQAFSWSLVSFFVNGGNDYFRTLTDAFMLLSPAGTVEENAQAVYKRIILFSPMDTLTKDYNAYFTSKKTFTDLIDEGQRAYGSKNFSGAEALFRQALELKSAHYAPYYYLGLLAYEEKKYPEAESFYKTALDYGAEKALVQYARGVNAAAAGNKAEALAYLQEASAADPATYKTRSEDLIKRLQ